MSKECNIIRDLLPLYAENMVCSDTEEFVKVHLEKCVECQKEYEQLKVPQMPEEKETKETAKPFLTIKRKLWKKRVQTAWCAALFAVALLISALAALSAPVYFPYEEDLFTIVEQEEGIVTLIFDERVTDYRCTAENYVGSEELVSEEARQCYRIEAWTSLWNQWFSKRGVQATTIPVKGDLSPSVYYCSNDGTEDICVYGQPITSGGVITLPRLVLGYYVLLAAVFAVVLFAVWCVVKKKPKVKSFVEVILLYPVSYCIGHLLVSGFDSGSYAAQRDFMWIVFLSIVLYGGLLLARSGWRMRK